MKYREVEKLLGICPGKKWKIIHGDTKLKDVHYLRIIALEFGLVCKSKGLAHTRYFKIGSAEPLSLEEGEKVFNYIIEQIHKRLAHPPQNDLRYRVKLLRYRTGLHNRDLGELVYGRVRAQFPAELTGQCSIDAGLTICRALDINPYWLAGGVKRFMPFREPKMPECNPYNLKITNICTPHSPPRKNFICDRHLEEKLAELQGRLGKRFYPLLRVNPQGVRRWMAGYKVMPATSARIQLALSHIYQSDNGFYSLLNNQPVSVPDHIVLSKLTHMKGEQYVRNVHAGKWAFNAFVSYRNEMRRKSLATSAERLAKRQQKTTDTLAV